ncbi:MAG TPA: hypothetical protein VMF67_02625 [Rhizomicrobium sp.]|nr:hypothetical protein [Rhizomicrobium sp.]
MARDQWSRLGRGDCEGYGDPVGGGDVRFHASGVRDAEGNYPWTSAINGRCSKTHATREEGMARIEFELR